MTAAAYLSPMTPSCFALISAHARQPRAPPAGQQSERLTQRKPLRVEPAPRKVAHHEPQVLDADLLPAAAQLALVVDAPHGRELPPDLGPDDVADRAARVAVPGREEHDVGGQLRAVLEEEARLREALDRARRLELDLAVDDLLRRADVCASGVSGAGENRQRGGGDIPR